MLKLPKFNLAGTTLVEVLVGVSIVAIVSIFVGVTVYQFSVVRNNILDDTKKLYLAEEAYETIRFLRDVDWSNISGLTNNTRYYLQVSTTTVAIGGTSELIEDRFNRNFLVQPVYRNASGNIVASTTSGASVDTDAKHLFIYVGDSKSTTTMQAILVNLPS